MNNIFAIVNNNNKGLRKGTPQTGRGNKVIVRLSSSQEKHAFLPFVSLFFSTTYWPFQ